MKKFLMLLALCTPMVLLSGCAGFIKSDVAVFHQLPETPSTTTYSFYPLEGQGHSLEYKSYQNQIRLKLQEYKFVEVPMEDKPEAIIAFNYGVDSGRESLSSVPIYGQTGVSSSTSYGTVNSQGGFGTYSGTTTYTPTYGVVGSSTVSSTKYGRTLWLSIVELKSVGTGNLNVLYEARVNSAGSSSQLPKVMPSMIEAIFKDFPGKSGETRRVLDTIP